MRLEIERTHIKIIPESQIDVAYLEEVLGLQRPEAVAVAKRVNALNLGALAYVKIEKVE